MTLFFIGLFLGALLGVTAAALCVAAKTDAEEENTEAQRAGTGPAGAQS